ncbi:MULTISPECIES: DUF4231 domain-containing protein [unclassified Variovorax]|uniref:DUF4231 domain-containing protein n=1 Tax=unclassified Variovorax TaxID=663243 RepID=UPI001BD38614|nr:MULTISPECIES: DUF4231 domain-containing protein [unclassified Variovorax]
MASQTDSAGAFQAPPEVARHPTWLRLEDQLRYYSRNCGNYRRRYQCAKVLQILLGAAIPVLALAGWPDPDFRRLSALFGASIAALEALIQLFQWHALWLQYRETSERLKREKWLMLAGAEPYAGGPSGATLTLLAERIETLMASEHDAWVGTVKQAAPRNPVPAPVVTAPAPMPTPGSGPTLTLAPTPAPTPPAAQTTTPAPATR